MENFIIGQWGSFDYDKFKKDYRVGIYGIEACLLNTEEDIDFLAAEACKKGLKIGIHYPLRGGVHKYRDPQFMTADGCARADFFISIEDEFNYIKRKGLKPEYILFHYPKPVILDESRDWSHWRFADKSEFVFETDYSCDEFTERSKQLFEWLTEKSSEYGFTPILELDAIGRYIYEINILEDLLERYDGIKLCLDIARLHYQTLSDKSFEPKEILKRFSKYTELVHFSNTRIADNIIYAHFPALPGLKASDGWADMNEYLPVIGQINRNVKITFEHRSDLITDEELDACYCWAEELLGLK